MTGLTEFNQDELFRLLALQSAQAAEYDDDDDEMLLDGEFSEYDDDDEEGFVEDYDDDDDEAFGVDAMDFADFGDDYDDDDDETYGESRRRRRRRGRLKTGRRRYRRTRSSSKRLRPVRGSRSTVLQSANGQRMRVKFGKSFAKAGDVNKLIKSTEAKFKAALKERKSNYDRLAKQIADNSKVLNDRVKTVAGKVKKLEGSAQTSQLLSLISGPPAIESIRFNTPPTAGAPLEVADVKYKSQDNLLPLLLAGGLGDGDGSDSNQTLLLALMLNNK
ncbi:MAG: hypothetical protein AAGF20_05305 [Pseudomonadota bacterium]